jgi:hypothetical protein
MAERERGRVSTPTLERWLDKRGLAEHLSCSVRSIQSALADGMPHAVIFGRVKFKVSEVEPWLEARGHIVRSNGTLHADDDRPGGAENTPGPDTRSNA